MGKSGVDRSIIDIYRLSKEERMSEYEAEGISQIKISERVFKNYGAYHFIWEKSYNESPVRSIGGAIDNLNSQTTFLTGHLKLDFSVMSIDDYRAIMQLHYSKNEFVVECYDVIYDKPIRLNMYFATEEMAKLRTIANKRLKGNGEWEEYVDLVGVDGYTVELIGTNTALDLVDVTYHLNPPEDTGINDATKGEASVYKGEELVIGAGSTFQKNQDVTSKGWKFKHWNTNPEGGDKTVYIDGYAYAINSDLVLYAIWERTTSHTLNFSYGIADPAIDDSEYVYETSRTVIEGKPIGDLPIAQNPKVTVDKKDYYPYYNGQWYRTAVKATNSVPVSNGALYWSERDSTVYLLFDVLKYPLKLYLDGQLYSENSLEYNTPMNLPILVKSGHKFDGWYTTPDFQKNTTKSGNMTPYALTLYARWVKID